LLTYRQSIKEKVDTIADAKLIDPSESLLKQLILDDNQFIQTCYAIYRVAECWIRSNKVLGITLKEIVTSTMHYFDIMGSYPTQYHMFFQWVCWELEHPAMPLILKDRPSAPDLLGITLDKFNYLCSDMVADQKESMKEEDIIAIVLNKMRRKIRQLFSADMYHTLGHPQHLKVMYKDIILKAFSIEVARLLREKNILHEDVSGKFFMGMTGITLLVGKEDIPTADKFFQQLPCASIQCSPDEKVVAIFGVTGLFLKAMCHKEIIMEITSPDVSQIRRLLEKIISSLTNRSPYYQSKNFSDDQKEQHKKQLFPILATEAAHILQHQGLLNRDISQSLIQQWNQEPQTLKKTCNDRSY